MFVNCLHIKQHQLRCLVDEHSWCFISEIGAICAVIYGVWLFTPPLLTYKPIRSRYWSLKQGTKSKD